MKKLSLPTSTDSLHNFIVIHGIFNILFLEVQPPFFSDDTTLLRFNFQSFYPMKRPINI